MKQETQKSIIYYTEKSAARGGGYGTTRHPYITVHKQYITAAVRCKSYYSIRNDFHVFHPNGRLRRPCSSCAPGGLLKVAA